VSDPQPVTASVAERVAARVADMVDRHIEKVLRTRYSHLNLFAQAFLEAVGAEARDCELVEVREGNEVRWFFRKREGT